MVFENLNRGPPKRPIGTSVNGAEGGPRVRYSKALASHVKQGGLTIPRKAKAGLSSHASRARASGPTPPPPPIPLSTPNPKI